MTNSEADVTSDLAELWRLHAKASVQDRGEWFVASWEDDDEHSWWLWSVELCAAGDECDHGAECEPAPVVALHADDRDFDREGNIAEYVAALRNAAPWLLDRAAAVEKLQAEVEDAVWKARQQAIEECAGDLAKALGSGETSWSHLVEAAEIITSIAGVRR